MILKGFKFGMMLQLAVGPVCAYVFTVGSNRGFAEGLAGVIAVTLIDALYIFFAILGIAKFIENEKAKKWFKLFGAVVVALFGLNIILSSFGFSLLPNFKIFQGELFKNTFLQLLFMTLSNPITILFWVGVFSTKIIEENLNKNQVVFYGMGCAFSTLVFLSFVALIGSISNYFLSPMYISLINILIGGMLLYFSFKILLKNKVL